MENNTLVVHNDSTLGPLNPTLEVLTALNMVLEEIPNGHVFLRFKTQDAVCAEVRIMKEGL